MIAQADEKEYEKLPDRYKDFEDTDSDLSVSGETSKAKLLADIARGIKEREAERAAKASAEAEERERLDMLMKKICSKPVSPWDDITERLESLQLSEDNTASLKGKGKARTVAALAIVSTFPVRPLIKAACSPAISGSPVALPAHPPTKAARSPATPGSSVALLELQPVAATAGSAALLPGLLAGLEARRTSR